MLGGRLARIDGPAKITGSADYAMEHSPEGMVYAVIIDSTIASGRVIAIDTAAAAAYPGVLLVLTPDNALPHQDGHRLDWRTAAGRSLPIHWRVRSPSAGQHIAAVIAETFEQATAAAALVKVTYQETAPISSFDDPRSGEGSPDRYDDQGMG